MTIRYMLRCIAEKRKGGAAVCGSARYARGKLLFKLGCTLLRSIYMETRIAALQQ